MTESSEDQKPKEEEIISYEEDSFFYKNLP